MCPAKIDREAVGHWEKLEYNKKLQLITGNNLYELVTLFLKCTILLLISYSDIMTTSSSLEPQICIIIFLDGELYHLISEKLRERNVQNIIKPQILIVIIFLNGEINLQIPEKLPHWPSCVGKYTV